MNYTIKCTTLSSADVFSLPLPPVYLTLMLIPRPAHFIPGQTPDQLHLYQDRHQTSSQVRQRPAVKSRCACLGMWASGSSVPPASPFFSSTQVSGATQHNLLIWLQRRPDPTWSGSSADPTQPDLAPPPANLAPEVLSDGQEVPPAPRQTSQSSQAERKEQSG